LAFQHVQDRHQAGVFSPGKGFRRIEKDLAPALKVLFVGGFARYDLTIVTAHRQTRGQEFLDGDGLLGLSVVSAVHQSHGASRDDAINVVVFQPGSDTQCIRRGQGGVRGQGGLKRHRIEKLHILGSMDTQRALPPVSRSRNAVPEGDCHKVRAESKAFNPQ
jgi:hypothetical protein